MRSVMLDDGTLPPAEQGYYFVMFDKLLNTKVSTDRIQMLMGRGNVYLVAQNLMLRFQDFYLTQLKSYES